MFLLLDHRNVHINTKTHQIHSLRNINLYTKTPILIDLEDNFFIKCFYRRLIVYRNLTIMLFTEERLVKFNLLHKLSNFASSYVATLLPIPLPYYFLY